MTLLESREDGVLTCEPIECLEITVTAGQHQVTRVLDLVRRGGLLTAESPHDPDEDVTIAVRSGEPDELIFEVTTISDMSDLRISYVTLLDNFDRVVFPDTGRWFMNSLSPISAWRFRETTAIRINSFATPAFVFENLGGNAAFAIGLLTGTREMDVRVHEPASNRALNVQHRRFRVEYELGAVGPALGTTQRFGWVSTREEGHTAWFDALRRFSRLEQDRLAVAYQPDAAALATYWCSWVDWSSDQMDRRTFTDNVAAGLELGVRHFILDDGWFGPGLDSDYGTPLNIGDWQPDPIRFPDMPEMLRELRADGAKVLLWCAPHAVGPASHSFGENASLLVEDDRGTPIVNPTLFYSLCFRSPEARARMLGVVTSLIDAYEIDGFKFDLFNWLPAEECAGVHHLHDTESAMEGLVLHLAEARRAIDAVGRPMIVELKQDYASPQAAATGTVVRAGDAPYASKTNLERMVYMQARNLPALNDYQTFSPSASAQDVALIGLRMIAGGIPSWGKDLRTLTSPQRATMSALHRWYDSLLARGLGHGRSFTTDGTASMELKDGTVVIQTESSRVTRLPPTCVALVNSTTDHTITLSADTERTIITRIDVTDGSTRSVVEVLAAGTSEIPLATGEVAVLRAPEER
ncbi:alpha-galactosidase [Clavibacter tessellarius]|uniref:Alpha-galactosidase n=1 Tax=Clavibacter tessellarius TaxID=31965 RepID=A0A154UZX1_9MICO|nr:alpha-galactosidase [Clavibacter michiganensis]KZC94663.1 hypothetical protein AWH51_12180 [Clavibacter michiganensis subsp. tessellarius]